MISRSFIYRNPNKSLDNIQEQFPLFVEALKSYPQLNLNHFSKNNNSMNEIIQSFSGDENSLAPYGLDISKLLIKYNDNITSDILKMNDLTLKTNQLLINSNNSMNLFIFGKFVNEGDNTIDGLELASILLYILGLTNTITDLTSLPTPLSWKLKNIEMKESSMFY